VQSYFPTVTNRQAWEEMFNVTTYVGTCKPIGPTRADVDNKNNVKAVPTTFCNAGIYKSNDTSNSVAQANIGSRYPTDSIVFTANVVVAATNTTASYTVSKTQCYYCKDAASCISTCDTVYKSASSYAYPAARICPCDNSCQINPTSAPTNIPTKKPVAKPTAKPT
jgi:hypothetical protein